MTGDCRGTVATVLTEIQCLAEEPVCPPAAITNLPPPPPPLPTAQTNRSSTRAEEDATNSAAARRAREIRRRLIDESAEVHVGGDGAELHGVLRGVRPRLRRHRPHPHPRPPRLLLRHRPQAQRLRRRPVVLPRRRRLRSPAAPQVRGGVAAGEGVPQVRQGGRGRRAVPAQGEPAGLRGVRPAPPRAPGHVLLPLHRQEVRQRRDQAGGRRERDGVRAHVRGQGRRLDARRRRPLEDVCGSLPTPSTHEELRGRQLSTKSCPMKHPTRAGLPERRRKLCSTEALLHMR